ncbi:MAG TPA: DUF58 domain-containing protein [Planctomycetaceae bacterium]|nr:DUF58 domain-containing protein [Planctomycetaceae bacterium]
MTGMDILFFDRRILLLLPVLLIPFLTAALGFRAFPTRRLVLFLLIPAVMSSLLFLSGRSWIAVAAADLVIVIFFVHDLLTLPLHRSAVAVERRTARIVSIAKRHPITLRVENRSNRPVTLTIRDDLDEGFEAEPEEFAERTIPPRHAELLEYQVRPLRRGNIRLHCVFLRFESVFGLWRRYVRIPCESDLHVYPDMQQLDQYEILARSDRLAQLGVRSVRRIGQDNDFERLRDYMIDDNFKQIDWRATAKRNKLTVKDFQATRNQRLIFMIDCGRMMMNRTGEGMSLLDHSFNAMLMLAYVALRQGDAVGMICFSNRLIRYVAPQSGRFQMNRLLHGVHDIFPESVETRFDDAFYYLGAHCRKRSLVALISNVNDPVNTERIRRHLTRLVGKHLPMGVFLRDSALFRPMRPFEESLRELREDTRIEDRSIKMALVTGKADRAVADREMWKAAAAAEIINTRHKTLADLGAAGTITLDLFPEELTAPMINKYLEIKARHLL